MYSFLEHPLDDLLYGHLVVTMTERDAGRGEPVEASLGQRHGWRAEEPGGLEGYMLRREALKVGKDKQAADKAVLESVKIANRWKKDVPKKINDMIIKDCAQFFKVVDYKWNL